MKGFEFNKQIPNCNLCYVSPLQTSQNEITANSEIGKVYKECTSMQAGRDHPSCSDPFLGYKVTTGTFSPNNIELLHSNVIGKYHAYKSLSYDATHWGDDFYTQLNFITNGNAYKVGFVGNYFPGGSMVSLPSSTSITDDLFVDFIHYDSITGNCYYNNIYIDKLERNLQTLFIRIDDALNIYFGNNKYANKLMCNAMDFPSLLNYVIEGGIKLGIEVNATTSTNFDIYTLEAGYKTNQLFVQNGIAFPNWGIRGNGGLSLLINQSFNHPSTDYTRYKIESAYGNISFGTRCVFTLKCKQIGFGNTFQLGVNIGTEIASSYIISTTTPSTFRDECDLLYSAVGNSVFVQPGSLIVLQPIDEPNPDVYDGQIYCRLDSDGRIYIGKNASSAYYIDTLKNKGDGLIHFYILGETNGVDFPIYEFVRY